ncbi:hypothetical protein R1T08_01980 [Streptomyces sp. SBC-4]|nr:hypothetical protein [Streptomyces sp. SBC-4]MDV5143116.1 hypothetical protein [Streptomyces sp. SBC-4]
MEEALDVLRAELEVGRSNARGERMEAGEVVLPDRGESFRQALTFAVREHDGERPDVTREHVQFGAVRPDGLEPNLLDVGEVLWAAEDPSGDGPGRGRPGSHRPR